MQQLIEAIIFIAMFYASLNQDEILNFLKKH